MFPSFLPAFGLGAIERQLENLHSLWDLRRPAMAMAGPSKIARATPAQSGPTPQEWEQSLGRMAIGRTPVTPLEELLVQDPGVPLVRELIHEFRASMVVTVTGLRRDFSC